MNIPVDTVVKNWGIIKVLSRLDRAATDVVLMMYPYYTRITPEIKVRVR